MVSPLGITTLGMLGGQKTYLAGGATIDISPAAGGIDVARGAAIDTAPAIDLIDTAQQRKALDLSDDGISIDL